MSTHHRQQTTDPERAAAPTLLRMIWGIHISRCVYAVAELGNAGSLGHGPLTSAELARPPTATSNRSTGCFARSLRWVYSRSTKTAVSALTVVGERLCTGAPAGMRSWATSWRPRRRTAIRAHPRNDQNGKGDRRSSSGSTCSNSSRRTPTRLPSSTRRCPNAQPRTRRASPRPYDFSDVRTIVDVGGGTGPCSRDPATPPPPKRTPV